MCLARASHTARPPPIDPLYIMSTGHGGGAPWRFLLADKELEEREREGVVGSLSGALSGLTIVPAADPSLSSYVWIGGGGARMLFAAPSRMCTGIYVALGPSLSLWD